MNPVKKCLGSSSLTLDHPPEYKSSFSTSSSYYYNRYASTDQRFGLLGAAQYAHAKHQTFTLDPEMVSISLLRTVCLWYCYHQRTCSPMNTVAHEKKETRWEECRPTIEADIQYQLRSNKKTSFLWGLLDIQKTLRAKDEHDKRPANRLTDVNMLGEPLPARDPSLLPLPSTTPSSLDIQKMTECLFQRLSTTTDETNFYKNLVVTMNLAALDEHNISHSEQKQFEDKQSKVGDKQSKASVDNKNNSISSWFQSSCISSLFSLQPTGIREVHVLGTRADWEHIYHTLSTVHVHFIPPASLEKIQSGIKEIVDHFSNLSTEQQKEPFQTMKPEFSEAMYKMPYYSDMEGWLRECTTYAIRDLSSKSKLVQLFHKGLYYVTTNENSECSTDDSTNVVGGQIFDELATTYIQWRIIVLPTTTK